MDRRDWRFAVQCAIRLSYREETSLEKLKERIDEIWKESEEDDQGSTKEEDGTECSSKSTFGTEENRACKHPSEH